MKNLETIAIYWTIGVWFAGAVLVTILVLMMFLWVHSMLFGRWAKAHHEDIQINIWVYRALRAWERAGHPRPNGVASRSEECKIRGIAAELIALAEGAGYVLTIESEPERPLAMGNHFMTYSVRPDRERYTDEAKRGNAA